MVLEAGLGCRAMSSTMPAGGTAKPRMSSRHSSRRPLPFCGRRCWTRRANIRRARPAMALRHTDVVLQVHTMAGCTHKHEMETWAPFVWYAHTNHIDLALHDPTRLTHLRLLWLHIFMEAAPPPSPNSPAAGHSIPAAHHTHRYHSTLAPIPISAPANSLIPSYLPAYLARLRASTPRVERVGIVLYLPEGRGLVLPSLSSPERELSGEGENEGREDTDPLLPALNAALASFPALRAVHVRVVPDYVGLLRKGLGRTAARFADLGSNLELQDAEAGAERQDAWRAELHVHNLDELHEEREQGSGTGGG
ncbi:hypothetical protein B0H14DRAFT_3662940 [Mycena olivaceomarginata]|nr:hypothetical protein B0H14DRAFT_3662940 [Mycena olivaceomarginata]